jgi:hypothetical protein
VSDVGQAAQMPPAFPPAGADVEDLRLAWRAACDEARLAYFAWRDAAVPRLAEAYAVFVAAAEREAVAAEVLARWTRER